MQGPVSASGNVVARLHEQLASRGFAPRQMALLEGLYGYCADEFGRRLEMVLDELERQLFRTAEQARSNEVQAALLAAQRRIHERRHQLTPAFITGLQHAIATLTDPPVTAPAQNANLHFSDFSLVETSAMDETVTLKEMATRCESRNNLALFLLGQRLGVVGRVPAFDIEHLPLGPRRICRVLRDAVSCFDFDLEQRGLVYQQFDHMVLQNLTPLIDMLNGYLVEQGVLPHLTYVAPRAPQQRRAAPAGGAAGSVANNEPSLHALPADAPDLRGMPLRGGGMPPKAPSAPSVGAGHAGLFPPPRPQSPRTPNAITTGESAAFTETFEPDGEGHAVLPWGYTVTPRADAGSEVDLFDTLRRLLSARRGLLDRLKPTLSNAPTANAAQVQKGLDHLQERLNSHHEEGAALSFGAIKRDLMAHLRQQSPEGNAPQLSAELGDTVDLVGMLFEQIGQDVRPQSTGGHLLSRLQLPLLRVAIKDQAFFTDHAHPARRLLEVVAETSSYWGNEDEIDRDLLQKMASLVRRANEETVQEPEFFDDLVTNLTSHLQTQQRKAEISERRQIEAARGREKLEIARLKAEEAVAAILADKAVPSFLRTLLEEAWIDVLSLALLRGGEQAPAYRQHLSLAEKLVATSLHQGQGTTLPEAEAKAMSAEIGSALTRVGYNQADATDIGSRLLAVVQASANSPEDESAQTDAAADATGAAAESQAPVAVLTEKLRGRDRLGQDVKSGERASARKMGERAAPLSDAEQTWHERIKRLPFGTWFEFTVNQQGEKAKRRMSWFSTVTDRCVFVNFKGQRAGDYTLTWLARELNRGNVTIVESEGGSIVDRAWKSIVSTLRSFSRGGSEAAASA